MQNQDKETQQKKEFDTWYRAIKTIVKYGEATDDYIPAEILEAVQEANVYRKDFNVFDAVSLFEYVKKKRSKPSRFA